MILPQGYGLRHYDVIDSTNAQARRMPDFDETLGLWIVAAEQTAGRGRRGREWISEPGNLFCSLLLKIHEDINIIPQLSFVTALAVRDVVADFLQADDAVKVKWPNDVLVGGEKISGILLESSAVGGTKPDRVIIGIGINITSHPENMLYPAADLGGADITADQVMERLADAMSKRVSLWRTGGFAPIRKEWLKRAKGQGEEIVVNLEGEEICGRFIDLDDAGALKLDVGGDIRLIMAGDVFFRE